MHRYTSQIALLKLILDDCKDMQKRFRALDRAFRPLSHHTDVRRRLRTLNRSLERFQRNATLCLIRLNLPSPPES